jgi:hypothetical protein
MRIPLLAAAWASEVSGVVGPETPELPATVRAAESARWPVVVLTRDGDPERNAGAAWDELRHAPGFDPVETSLVVLDPSGPRAAVVAGQRWEAELGLTDARNRLIVAEASAHLPPGAPPDALGASVVRALDDAITRARVSAETTATAERNRRRAVGAALGLGLLGSASALGLLRRREAAEARAALDVDLERWAAALRTARTGLEALPPHPDVPAHGAQTIALFEEAARSSAALEATLEAIDRRLAGLRHAARRAGPFDAVIPARLRRNLGEQLGLGGSERGTLEAWASGWPTRLATALMTRQRARDASDASRRTAREDLPIDAFEAARTRADAAGIPRRWLADHPLAASPEAAWAALDARREADPAGYLDALRAALNAEEAALDRVAVLEGERRRVAEVSAGRDMPEVAGAVARFAEALASSDRLDAIRDRADAVFAACEADVQRRAALSEARARIPRERRAASEAAKRATAALRTASDAAWVEDLTTRMDEVRSSLDGEMPDPVGALASISSAAAEATRVVREATERIALLDELRRDPVLGRGRLDQERAARLVRLKRAAGDEAALAEGDALPTGTPSDVAAVLRSWEDAARRAETAQAARDAARRDTRLAAERAERAAADRRSRDAADRPALGPTYASLTALGSRRAPR